MPDREKVIKGLNDIGGFVAGRLGFEQARNFIRTINDVIALLQEQEPTTFKPHYIDIYGKHFICGVECGSCHKEISSTYHYCPYCGRRIVCNDTD